MAIHAHVPTDHRQNLTKKCRFPYFRDVSKNHARIVRDLDSRVQQRWQAGDIRVSWLNRRLAIDFIVEIILGCGGDDDRYNPRLERIFQVFIVILFSAYFSRYIEYARAPKKSNENGFLSNFDSETFPTTSNNFPLLSIRSATVSISVIRMPSKRVSRVTDLNYISTPMYFYLFSCTTNRGPVATEV